MKVIFIFFFLTLPYYVFSQKTEIYEGSLGVNYKDYVKYSYYTDDNLNRVYNGYFKYEGKFISNIKINIVGNYKNNNRVGEWSYILESIDEIIQITSKYKYNDSLQNSYRDGVWKFIKRNKKSNKEIFSLLAIYNNNFLDTINFKGALSTSLNGNSFNFDILTNKICYIKTNFDNLSGLLDGIQDVRYIYENQTYNSLLKFKNGFLIKGAKIRNNDGEKLYNFDNSIEFNEFITSYSPLTKYGIIKNEKYSISPIRIDNNVYNSINIDEKEDAEISLLNMLILYLENFEDDLSIDFIKFPVKDNERIFKNSYVQIKE